MSKLRIAIYARLSKEDEKNDDESNSIVMQCTMLEKFVQGNFPEYQLLRFVDDGYTGTNFNRPGIQDLLMQVKDCQVDCIVVKDFSRFVRDYIELGTYLEQIFPFMGVRFISVNDGYDSDKYLGTGGDIDVNFKGLVYDLYSKDLSQKVSSSLKTLKEKGLYVSANAPFGYEKDKNDRHMLIVEKEEAAIVKRIFELRHQNKTSYEIAELLNQEHVKTPIEFKIAKGECKRSAKGNIFLWNPASICRILKNPIYIGDIVQGKYKSDGIHGKHRSTPKEKWIIHHNHHEAIIDRDLFEKVQWYKPKKPKCEKTDSHPLTGKVICGMCGRSLIYRDGFNPYFYCRTKYSSHLKSCDWKWNVMFLEQAVLFRLQERILQQQEMTKLFHNEYDAYQSEIQSLETEKIKYVSRKSLLEEDYYRSYEDYALGHSETFIKSKNEIKGLDDKIRELGEKIIKLNRSSDELLKKAESLDWSNVEFSKELVKQFIDKIIILSESDFEIVWRNSKMQ